MPRKQQGWITFQSSEEERKILEEYCQQSQRSKTEILRELVRSLNQQSASPQPPPSKQERQETSGAPEIELVTQESEIKAMKVSARNILRGRIKRVVTGSINTEITLEIAPKVELTSIITRSSAEQLDLSVGKEAYALIKSSNIMIAMG